jgi:TRIAD3 protein (E3 ubiquitin-protein ligase RNF216)
MPADIKIGMEVSCRLCREKSHIPLTCQEYAKENRLSVRHTVEEAMTEALVRKCK